MPSSETQSSAEVTPDVVEVVDGDHVYRFRAVNKLERWRAESMLVKEAGTIAWIRDVVRPGEVFVDVGANIGHYSVFAARHVSPSGFVYAFEPHVGNFFSLLQNVKLNDLMGVIWPLDCALHDDFGVLEFNYTDLQPGSSMNQLGSTKDASEKPFAPAMTELKVAMPLDMLVNRGVVRPPDHIKIDVDGNEMLVLRGMRRVLAGARKPKSLQVEINSRYKAELYAFMSDMCYEQYRRDDTQLGHKLIAAGRDPETVAHNALFRPR